MEKKELTKSQTYAVKASNTKMVSARIEFQDVMNNIAEEVGADGKNETWILSKDMRFLERQMVAPEINPKKKE